ncbi:hypothetical protein C5167_020639 [Papaver somniferum]|uniref:Uncharacterized protein n=1 Tax=Papaver somniferum TaxID=3469 RepID=A0A4Y7IU45_PAPSO|nr:hypothetical protein C5167_020639 [Papaver somniferum]
MFEQQFKRDDDELSSLGRAGACAGMISTLSFPEHELTVQYEAGNASSDPNMLTAEIWTLTIVTNNFIGSHKLGA